MALAFAVVALGMTLLAAEEAPGQSLGWPLEQFAAPPAEPLLAIESFGGGVAQKNNAPAIALALAACDKAGGCTLVFRGPGTYVTSAINLTSNLRLQVDEGASLAGSMDSALNCNPARPGGNCTSSPTWPVLPTPVYPSTPAGAPGGGASPAMQAWIRSYNVSNLEITGGGIIDGGGPWWWCTRFYSSLAQCPAPPKPCWDRAKSIERINTIQGCAAAVKAGTVPVLTFVPPRMLHLVESHNIHIHNVTIQHSPYWTVHFQFSDHILFEDNHVFNPNNATFETPNGDGIDMDSSTDALVRNNIVDVGDDALCCKSGANWLGRRSGGCNAAGVCVGRPTRNVLWTDNEVRNGHGLTLGSDAAGGVINVTYRNIFLNGMGGPQAVGKRSPPGGIGGPHFKTQRGRGGHWENVTWDNIYGTFAVAGISFGEDHGGSASANPPTNASATPTIRNMAVINIDLTVLGPSMINTLAEAPIQNLTLRNITLRSARRSDQDQDQGGSSAGVGWACQGQQGTREVPGRVFASGTIEDVTPGLGACSFAPTPPTPPPPPPAPAPRCTAKAVLGCFNDSTPAMRQAAGWAAPPGEAAIHDRVTRGDCAALCDLQHASVAAIDQGNHCACGSAKSAAASTKYALPAASCQAKEWPCTGSCCGPHAHAGCTLGPCTGTPAEQCGGPGALIVFTFTCV